MSESGRRYRRGSHRVELDRRIAETVVSAIADTVVDAPPANEAQARELAAEASTSPPRRAVVESPWLTRTQAAERANVSIPTVDRAIRNGDLRATRPGGGRRVVIHVEWLHHWVATRARQ